MSLIDRSKHISGIIVVLIMSVPASFVWRNRWVVGDRDGKQIMGLDRSFAFFGVAQQWAPNLTLCVV